MLIVGERINATRKRIGQAIDGHDARWIAREARRQAEAGAHYIDVNAGHAPLREPDNFAWAVQVVLGATDRPLCLDSANPDVLRRGIELAAGRPVMLNSTTAEEARTEQVMPLAAESGASLVALAMDDRGVPTTADERVEIAGRLVEAAERLGVPRDRLYIDPCIKPISTDVTQGMAVIEAVRRIMQGWPGVHTICGLSNVSYGLPDRGLVNRTFLACLIAAGLDAAIIDPTAEGMTDAVLAAEAIAGRDDYCMNYVRAMRARMANS